MQVYQVVSTNFEKEFIMADLTIATVNVCGLNSAVDHGMEKWLETQRKNGLDILCLQETRISKDLFDICKKLNLQEKDLYLQKDENDPRYHGVATWVNPETCQIVSVETPFEHTVEAKESGFSGRWQEIIIKFSSKEIVIANSYYHRAKSPTHKDNGVLISREKAEKLMNDKHKFFAETTKRMRELMAHNNFILVGDINTAHHGGIDIKNYKDNKKHAGFLSEERAWLDLWFAKKGDINVQSTYVEGKTAMEVYSKNSDIDYEPPKTNEFLKGGLGLHDVVRENAEEGKTYYSFWSRRPTKKGFPFDNDVGWRIDYQIATENMAKSVKRINIPREEYFELYEKCWSDHAPVVVTYSL
jgi:exodeoxyribonuclease-3